MARIPRRVARKMAAALTYTETDQPTGTCLKCRLPIRRIAGQWTDERGSDCCYADPSPSYTPHEPEERL